jgi:hypothetical protein
VDPDQHVSISRAEAAALLGLTSNIEALAPAGDVSPHAQAKVRQRLARDISVDDTTPLTDLLDGLSQRLHHALGDHT